MRSLLEKTCAWRIYDLLKNPDRFREVLVIVLTGVGDDPVEIAQILTAWLCAVLIARTMFSKKN